MRPRIGEILSALEAVFPLSLQEEWDNSGLQVGDPSRECSGVLFAVEATEATVQECIDRGYNLLITHHPILFHALKRISVGSYVERTVALAIKNDVAIYASHTASDNALCGLNDLLAQRLGLTKKRPLVPMAGQLYKLEVTVPHEYTHQLKQALFDAGAGELGRYAHCCFTYAGCGEFLPLDGANPFIGEQQAPCQVDEDKLSLLVTREALGSVRCALREAHPYEEPAYEFIPIDNARSDAGSGLIGELESPLSEEAALQIIASMPHVESVAHSALLSQPISRVAIVSGSGGSFLGRAYRAGCQLMLTGEAKYNDYLDAAGYGILLVTIGHFESEKVACEVFMNVISKKFPNFALAEALTDLNPVNYFPRWKMK